MIMDLPSSYTFDCMKEKNNVYIKNSILVIRNTSYFRKAVYDITFCLKGGKHHCSYCDNYFVRNKVTLDHMYPQDMGGPTITNNLIPACTQCNSEKSNMTVEEYKTFLQLKNKNDIYYARKYLKSLQEKKENLRKSKKYQIPESWISEKEISKVFVEFSLNSEPSQYSKYNRIKDFYYQYGYFKNAIIVDKNGFLLDGFYSLIFAKAEQISYVPVIQLENVEVCL